MFFGGIRRSIPSYAQGFGGLSSSHSSTAIGRGFLRRRINSSAMNADATFNSLIPLHPPFPKGDFFIFFEIHQPGISEAKLTDRSYIMSGELALPDFGIGIIRKDHGSHAIRDDACLLQFFMISPNVV